jgi:2-hydroxychromene-2-carboxylate isomerase
LARAARVYWAIQQEIQDANQITALDLTTGTQTVVSYLSVCRIEALAARSHVEVRWRPFTLHPIFRAVGWQTSPFVIYTDKGRHMWRDVEREAERHGIPFRKPTVFPRNSVPAAKVAVLGVDENGGWGPAFIRRVMEASFVHDIDIATPALVDSILRELGLDGPSVRQEAASPGRSDALRRSTKAAIELGIFGAPTFMVGDEMFWGNDRLESALDWATRHY